MGRIVLDPFLRTRLNGLGEQLEVCDEAGKTIGHFLPESVYRELLIAWSRLNLSDEELERRRSEPRGRTLAEILTSLGAR
jgi:hypothetical protein